MDQELAGLLLLALMVGIPIVLAKLQKITPVPPKGGKTWVMECDKCGRRTTVTVTWKHT